MTTNRKPKKVRCPGCLSANARAAFTAFDEYQKLVDQHNARVLSILRAPAVLDAIFDADPGYDGPCPGIGLPAPCPACGCDGFKNADGTIRYHAVGASR